MSEKLSNVAVAGVEKLLADWAGEDADISDGVSLLSRVSASKLPLSQPSDVMRKRLVTALALEASTGCRADELRELLDAVDSEELDAEQATLLRRAAEVYKQRWFSDELGTCDSETEFDGLAEDLELIASFADICLEEEKDAVKQAREELEAKLAFLEEQRYDEWREQRHERTKTDSTIHDLFDSLRS